MTEISLAEYRQQIKSTIEQGRYEEAVAHGRYILERYPKYMRAYWLLGEAMLEAGQDEHATDMFQRALSVDPEHLPAWVGMSEIAKQRGEPEAAVWYLERAFELATDNEKVASELRHLYGELEGREPERLQLTQGALARLYLRGDLLSRAIRELRKLLDEHPDRVDLKVALAEALWRSGQRLQAADVCQEILEEQPYSLKANLIIGEIWTNSGREEGEFYLERAEAVDPENQVAQELFGSSSPLALQEPRITLLEYEAIAEEEAPAWMVPMDELGPAEEGALVEPEELVTAKIEIPQWLQELTGETTPEAIAPPAPEEEEFVEEVPAPSEEGLEEPAAVEEVAPEEIPLEEMPLEEMLPEGMPPEGMPPEGMPPEGMAEEEALEWLSELEEGEVAVQEPEEGVAYEPEEEAVAFEREEEIPAWLSELGVEPAEEEWVFEAEERKEGQEAGEPERAEIPDWLQDLAPAGEELSTVPPPDALAALLEEEVPAGEEPEDITELPAWLESEEMPSGDEALAWLEQLTEGKEEELLVQAEAESEARLAEIMGRPKLEPEEVGPEGVEEEPEKLEEELEAEEAELEAEEVGAVEEGALEAFELEGELPAWLESEEMPSGDEALAWLEQLTEGKEEKLLAQAEAESEARLAEIMGRPELAPEEVGPEKVEEEREEPTEEIEAEEPALEAEEVGAPEEGAPEEEAFGWTAFAEAAPAKEVEAVELPGVEEPEEEGPPEEAEFAPAEEEALETPAVEEPEEAMALEELEEEEALAEAEEEEAAAAVVEVPEEIAPIEEAEALVEEGAFGWTAFAEETIPEGAEVTPEEEIPAEAEAEEPGVAEEAAPEVEAPEAVEEVSPVEEAEPEAAPAEELALEAVEEPLEPEVVSAEEEAAPAALVEEPSIEDLNEFIAKQRAYAEEHPEDHEAWLELGRVLWQADRREEAIETYDRLIRHDGLLDEIIPDLEDYAEQWSDPSAMQALGDAYMRADRLQDALDVYHRALASL